MATYAAVIDGNFTTFLPSAVQRWALQRAID